MIVVAKNTRQEVYAFLFFSSIIIEVKAKFILKIFVIRKRKPQKRSRSVKSLRFLLLRHLLNVVSKENYYWTAHAN